MKPFLILPAFLVCLGSAAQITIKKNTGSYYLPSNSDTLNNILNISTDGTEPGPAVGKTINFFKLYNANNDSLDIALELSKGKPIFLFSGSYTCPNYRNEIKFLDSLEAIYKNKINFFMIYTIEAHPHYPDPSPYTNTLFIPLRNLTDSIIYRQPKTYGQRKLLSETMISRTKSKIPVYIDSPSNQWLNNFGTLPNIAYLIDTSGKVFSKYLSYDRMREEIKRDLKTLSKKKA